MPYNLLPGIALADAISDVNAPKPFRLLKKGANDLTKNGFEYQLTLSDKHIADIANYQKMKGEKIPIDSRHSLLVAATNAGVEEDDAIKTMPHKCAALGFADLEARDDGLYAVNVELLPLAAELFKNGALRYYSPVIRGLDGSCPLRVSSVAMDNTPALNNLDMIAASDEENGLTNRQNQRKESVKMTPIEQALQKLFGDSTLALSDNTSDAVAAKLIALADELPELRRRAAQSDALALAAETAQKNKLIDDAIAKNKFCNAQRESLLKLDKIALADFIEKSPENNFPGVALPEVEKKDEELLTDEEKKIARSLGLTDEEYLKSKKEKGE